MSLTAPVDPGEVRATHPQSDRSASATWTRTRAAPQGTDPALPGLHGAGWLLLMVVKNHIYWDTHLIEDRGNAG